MAKKAFEPSRVSGQPVADAEVQFGEPDAALGNARTATLAGGGLVARGSACTFA